VIRPLIPAGPIFLGLSAFNWSSEIVCALREKEKITSDSVAGKNFINVRFYSNKLKD
jgi:hypothetical protein